MFHGKNLVVTYKGIFHRFPIVVFRDLSVVKDQIGLAQNTVALVPAKIAYPAGT